MAKSTDKVKVRLTAPSGRYKFPCGTVLTPLKPKGEIDRELAETLSYVEIQNVRDKVRPKKVSGGSSSEQGPSSE